MPLNPNKKKKSTDWSKQQLCLKSAEIKTFHHKYCTRFFFFFTVSLLPGCGIIMTFLTITSKGGQSLPSTLERVQVRLMPTFILFARGLTK